MTLNEHKAALRKELRAAQRNISPAARNAASAQLCTRLKEQLFWKNSASILFFAPLPDEADVWPLLEETVAGGKITALPRFNPEGRSYAAVRVKNLQGEIITGQFGIREPAAHCPKIALAETDLILVPGIAFDSFGRRLGRGKGFYDRLLAKTRGVKCGIAFDEQIAGEVPAGEQDLKMNFILTPTRCLKIAG
jgi:5-formyltetrahydrofolate cyclo-ligase